MSSHQNNMSAEATQSSNGLLVWPKRGPIAEIYEQVGLDTAVSPSGLPGPIAELLNVNDIPIEDFVAFWRIDPETKKQMLAATKAGIGCFTLFPIWGCVLLPCTVGGYPYAKSQIESQITVLTKTKIIRYFHASLGSCYTSGRDIEVIDLNTVLSVNVDAQNKGTCACFSYPKVELQILGRQQVRRSSYVEPAFSISTSNIQRVAALIRRTKDELTNNGGAGEVRGIPSTANKNTNGNMNGQQEDPFTQLKQLKVLFEEGILDAEEFSTKKREILAKM